MKSSREFRSALGACAAALGMGFLSGRTPAVFYGQMGRTSWLGVCFAAVFYGTCMGLLAHLVRSSSPVSLAQLLRRIPGRWLGRPIAAVWGAFALTAACKLVAEAGHITALLLPVHCAAPLGAALALLLALLLGLAGPRAMCAAGGLLVACAALLEAIIILRTGAPDAALLRGAVELRLRDEPAAALLFALMHAACCVCMSAGAQLALTDGRIRPVRQGVWSGSLFFLLLAGANAALRAGEEALLGLKQPFAALVSGWGKGGFFMISALIFAADVLGLTGLFCGFEGAKNARKRMLNYKK